MTRVDVLTNDLSAALAAVCPIIGLCLADMDDKESWRVDPAEHATEEQIAAATALIASYDPATAETCAAIDAIRNARIAGGFVDTVTGRTFQTDDVSQRKLTSVSSAALVAVVMQTGDTFDLIPVDNVTMSGLTGAETLAILMRVFRWVSDTMIYANALKQTARAGETVDTENGWPT